MTQAVPLPGRAVPTGKVLARQSEWCPWSIWEALSPGGEKVLIGKHRESQPAVWVETWVPRGHFWLPEPDARLFIEIPEIGTFNPSFPRGDESFFKEVLIEWIHGLDQEAGEVISAD